MMIIDLIIIGAGGTSLQISQIIDDINAINKKYNMIGFLDDDENKIGKELCGYPVLGKISNFSHFEKCHFILAGFATHKDIGRVKRNFQVMELPHSRFETVIHPSATVSQYASIGNGCVISPGVRIMPRVKIGNHVCILSNSYLAHDVVIGDFTTITNSVSIAGGTTIETGCYLGANSSIIGGIHISANSLVGIGTVVLKDVEANSVVVGNPARLLRKTEIHTNE